jgi:hypothetical protein
MPCQTAVLFGIFLFSIGYIEAGPEKARRSPATPQDTEAGETTKSFDQQRESGMQRGLQVQPTLRQPPAASTGSRCFTSVDLLSRDAGRSKHVVQNLLLWHLAISLVSLQKVHFGSIPPQTPILLKEEGLQKVTAKVIDGTRLIGYVRTDTGVDKCVALQAIVAPIDWRRVNSVPEFPSSEAPVAAAISFLEALKPRLPERRRCVGAAPG